MSDNKVNMDIDIDWGCEEVKELSRTVLPEPDLLNFYNQKAQRQIYINEMIDDPIVDYAYQIIQWNKDDKDLPIEHRKKIKIFLHSPVRKYLVQLLK
jgi:ATP-dependent Clp protease protease subunit